MLRGDFVRSRTVGPEETTKVILVYDTPGFYEAQRNITIRMSLNFFFFCYVLPSVHTDFVGGHAARVSVRLLPTHKPSNANNAVVDEPITRDKSIMDDNFGRVTNFIHYYALPIMKSNQKYLFVFFSSLNILYVYKRRSTGETMYNNRCEH